MNVVGLYPNIPRDEGLIVYSQKNTSWKRLKRCIYWRSCWIGRISFEKLFLISMKKLCKAIETRFAPSHSILLYVRSADSHQCLDSSSCHPCHCKKSIPYLLSITPWSGNIFWHCNNLEKWLSETSYSEKLVRKEILKARSQSRETLLNKEKMSRNNDRVSLMLRTILSLKTLETC